MKWDRENPYLFLDVWRRHGAKMEDFSKNTRSVWERYFGEDNEQSLKLEEKTKNFWKTVLKNAKHAFFATELSRQQVARSSRQNTQRKKCEKFSKCFSRLKGLPSKESRTKPRKSPCTPHDWTLHSRTSRQT